MADDRRSVLERAAHAVGTGDRHLLRVVKEDMEHLLGLYRRAKDMIVVARAAKPSSEVDEFLALVVRKLGDDFESGILKMTERDWSDLEAAFDRIKK